eukprot:11334443-Prorocentrum_lima.AAC.1
MTSSLVGSEMCIRDRSEKDQAACDHTYRRSCRRCELPLRIPRKSGTWCPCLLYTSDAADDM